MNILQVETPNYVLLHRTQRISPKLIPLDSGRDYVAIYGFSDKQPYDAFCQLSDLELVPYPLVKGYLRNRLEVAGDAILIIVIDAAGPNEAILNAATMQTVLDAHEAQSPTVTVSQRLTKDERTQAYHIEEYGADVRLQLHE